MTDAQSGQYQVSLPLSSAGKSVTVNSIDREINSQTPVFSQSREQLSQEESQCRTHSKDSLYSPSAIDYINKSQLNSPTATA